LWGEEEVLVCARVRRVGDYLEWFRV